MYIVTLNMVQYRKHAHSVNDGFGEQQQNPDWSRRPDGYSSLLVSLHQTSLVWWRPSKLPFEGLCDSPMQNCRMGNSGPRTANNSSSCTERSSPIITPLTYSLITFAQHRIVNVCCILSCSNCWYYFLPSALHIGLYLIIFIVIFIVNVVAIGTHNIDTVSVECIDCCCSTTNFRLRGSKK